MAVKHVGRQYESGHLELSQPGCDSDQAFRYA